MSILAASDPAEFRGLVGIGMKKAQTAAGRSGATGFAGLGLSLAAGGQSCTFHLRLL
jgi:hypothetical protein